MVIIGVERKRLAVVPFKILRFEFRSHFETLKCGVLKLMSEAGSTDQLQIARLKKRKLRLKDQIAAIEDTLLPDIIA